MTKSTHGRRKHAARLLLLSILTLPAMVAADVDRLPESECVTLPPAATYPEAQRTEISGAALTADGRFMVLAADEESQIHVLAAGGSDFDLLTTVDVGEGEADFEGVTRHGDAPVFFVVGSHSWRRRSIDSERRYSKNKERFEDRSPDRQRERDRLVRLRIDPQTGLLVEDSVLDIPLRASLYGHPVLRHFNDIPSKENGIDIEGIASDGDKLYIGFRGPVLRYNLATVLVISPEDHVAEPDLRYLDLGGRGIRDLAPVSGGFLVLAGPVGDAALSYEVYFWDGNDGLPGERRDGDPPLGEVLSLGTIPTLPDAKAEALVVLNEEVSANTALSWKLLVLHDGLAGGGPACFEARP